MVTYSTFHTSTYWLFDYFSMNPLVTNGHNATGYSDEVAKLGCLFVYHYVWFPLLLQ